MRSDQTLPQEQVGTAAGLKPDTGSPGALRGQAWLTVQTRQAQQLIRGRNGTPDKPAIIGLVGFADRLRIVWQAARDDDPYADWWLIKVDDALKHARKVVAEEQSEIDDRLVKGTEIEVVVAKSLRPYRVPLQFANPYAYRGAHLIAEYDTLVRTLLTGCHVGLLDRESSEKLIKRVARKIRGVFSVPQSYHLLGITRDFLQQDSDKKALAHQRMGELPTGVLSGEHQAELMPRKTPFPKSSHRSLQLNALSPAPDTGVAANANHDT